MVYVIIKAQSLVFFVVCVPMNSAGRVISWYVVHVYVHVREQQTQRTRCPCTTLHASMHDDDDMRGMHERDRVHGLFLYLLGNQSLVELPTAAPVADDEQAEGAVVLGRVLQPDQLRGGRRAQERSHGEKGEER